MVSSEYYKWTRFNLIKSILISEKLLIFLYIAYFMKFFDFFSLKRNFQQIYLEKRLSALTNTLLKFSSESNKTILNRLAPVEREL